MLAELDCVGAAVASVAVTLVLGALARSAGGTPRLRADHVELTYPPAGRAVLVAAGALLLAVAVVTVFLARSPDASAEDRRLAWLAAPLGVLGVAGLLEQRVRLAMDRTGIRGRTAFRGRRELAWSDVVDVRYSRGMGWFVLRGRGGATLRISRLLRGHTTLLDVLKDEVPRRAWQSAVAEYRAN